MLKLWKALSSASAALGAHPESIHPAPRTGIASSEKQENLPLVPHGDFCLSLLSSRQRNKVCLKSSSTACEKWSEECRCWHLREEPATRTCSTGRPASPEKAGPVPAEAAQPGTPTKPQPPLSLTLPLPAATPASLPTRWARNPWLASQAAASQPDPQKKRKHPRLPSGQVKHMLENTRVRQLVALLLGSRAWKHDSLAGPKGLGEVRRAREFS